LPILNKMTNLKKKNIYLPQNVNTICQQYNNGYIIWMSGANSTTVQYLENTNKMPLSIEMSKNSLELKKTNLKRSQTFYSIYQKSQEKKADQYYNLVHMQLKRAVLSTTVGIKKYLLVRGVGYKFLRKNQYLTLQVGYSHKINVLLPSFIKTKLNRKATKIKFMGSNLAFMTGLISSIRRFKKPDVYKGKGIRYRKDNVMRKEGKKKKSF